MAEAVLNQRAKGRVIAASAGSRPASRVHPMTVEVLGQHGIDWRDKVPKGLDDVQQTNWDMVITVCDRAKESCPVFPGRPAAAHWGMPDPAEALTPDEQRRAFTETLVLVSRRIDLMLALPIEKLERLALEHRLQRIAESNQ
jgi:arsenate reductase